MCTQWSFLLLWRDFCFSAIGRYPYLWYHIATDGAGYFYERESSVDLFDKYPNVIIKGLTYSPKEVSSVLKRVINIRWKFLIYSKKKKIWGSFDNKFNKYMFVLSCVNRRFIRDKTYGRGKKAWKQMDYFIYLWPFYLFSKLWHAFLIKEFLGNKESIGKQRNLL